MITFLFEPASIIAAMKNHRKGSMWRSKTTRNAARRCTPFASVLRALAPLWFILFCLTTPITRAVEPTTRPSVLLLRFAALNDSAGTEWIGRAVQQSLLTDAAKMQFIRISADQSLPTTDLNTARQ